MIKECPIIKRNEYVTVVRFDNTDIQFPAVSGNQKTVFVSHENGKYFIVEKQVSSNEKPVRATDKKREKFPKKKTTPESSIAEDMA